MSASERGRLIWKLADLVEKHIDELAELETLDNGKPIFESRYVDMPMVIDVLRYYAGWATKIHGETVNTFEPPSPTRCASRSASSALIVPWNFPLAAGLVEAGPGTGLREHAGAEARRADSADHPRVRRTRRRSRISRRRAEHRDRRAGDRQGASSRIPVSTRSRSPVRPLSARKSCAAPPTRSSG